MTELLATAHAALVRHGGPGHGLRFGLLIVVVLVVVAVVLIQRQRRKDRTTMEVASPTAVTGDGGTSVAVVGLAEPIPTGHYHFGDLLRAEWTKLRTVRSTGWTLLITVVLGLGISAIATAETRAHWASGPVGQHVGFDPTATSLIGIFVAQFAVGALGVLAMSSEYSSGTIRTTFSAAPNRLRVLLAKLVVFGVLAVVFAEVVSFASFFLGQALLTSPATHATLSSPGALRAVVGCGLFVAALGVLALGLATMMRFTAAALSTFVGILLIAPLIVQALPTSLSEEIRRFLPDRIGAAILTTTGPSPFAFSPWVGLGVLALYAVGVNVVGAVLLVRRDA
ncbi:MAG TPA: ABC transporter permease [Acidimicrobiales bacterium]|nr:MAG: hypothetical protein B7Z69_07640 [Actinobacteria bacterium 21-73-9]HQU26110.1 ABC transporter permease [Acidimicrobiales bacterium]